MSRYALRLLLCCLGSVACSSGGPDVPSTPPASSGMSGASGAGAANGGATSGGAASGGTPNPTAGAAPGGADAGAGVGGVPQGGAGGSVSGGAGQGGVSAGAGGGGQGGGGGGPAVITRPKRVLLYHFSTLSIASVPAQLALLKTQLEAWSYEVEDSVDPTTLSQTNLQRFAAVGMINTCFEPFGSGKMGSTEAATLAAFVDEGGGLFGTHCASVTFQSAEPPHPYNAVIGGRGGDGYFDGKSACRTTEQHATTQLLPATFDYTGNLDNADYLATDTKVLVRCKWSDGDKKDVAVSWYRTPGKGRVFYTNFAKEDKDLSDATLGGKHIIVGLGWVLGR